MTSDSSDPHSSKPLFSKLSRIFKKSGLIGNEEFDSEAYDQLDLSRKDMIKGVFELSQKNARDIMIPRVDVIAVDSQTELKPLVKIACDAGHSRLPVFEDKIDNIIGILYVKDLLKLLLERANKKFQLKKSLHTPFFVPETMPLDELLLEFKRRKLHIAVVVDEYGGVGGVVTLEDILEEIVGEIEDEFDASVLPELIKISSNSFEVDSRMTLSDFNEQMKQNLPTVDFDTIGGYVYDLFGKIPEKDEVINNEELTFKIKDINGTKINRITITINKK